MSPSRRGAVVITVLLFALMWGASALGYYLTGVPE